MTEKLRAHDYSTREMPTSYRPHPKPWYAFLLNPLRCWWSGTAGIVAMNDISNYTTGRQAAWQVVRVPLALLLFLYTASCLIAGRLVSFGVFRGFLSQVFGWQSNGDL
jgi:hypothetical protein